jgi:O-antigen ligase
MLSMAKEHSSFTDRPSAGGVLWIILALVGLCVLVIFADRPLWFAAIATATVLVLSVLANPIVGVLALFALGMLGDLQHLANFPSLSVLLVPCVAVGFAVKSQTEKWPTRNQLVMWLFLFTVMYCAGMCSGLKDAGELARPAIFAGYVVGFFLVLNIVRTRKEIKMAFFAVAIGAAIVSFALITQWLGMETPLSLLSRPDLPMSGFEAAKGVERTLGFARDPNAAAYPCILASPVLLALASTTKRLWARLVIIALFGATVVGLATTQSLSGDLGLGVSLTLFILLARARARFWLVPVLVILFGLAITYLPVSDFTARFASAQNTYQTDRKVQYEVGYALFEQHPLLGPGEEAFIAEMSTRSDLYVLPHSNLLSVLTVSGLVGFVPLLCFILGYARFLFRYWPKLKDRTLKLYAAGAIAAVAGIHAQGMFICNMGWFSLWAMTAIPICALLADEERIPDPTTVHYGAYQIWRRTGCRSEVSVL